MSMCNSTPWYSYMFFSQVSIGRGRAGVYRYQVSEMQNSDEHFQHAVQAESSNKVSL